MTNNLQNLGAIIVFNFNIAKWAGAVEYTNCFSAEG